MADYPPDPGPKPSPTPRPTSPGYISPADYMKNECDLVKEMNLDDTVSLSTVYTEMLRIYQVMRDAET